MKQNSKRILASLLVLVMIAGIFVELPKTTVKAAKTIASINITVKHPSMNTVKLSWGKVSEAYGYNVYYKEKESDTYRLASSTLDNKIVFDGLSSDKFYYFKVTAYKVVSGKQVVVASSKDYKVRSNKIGIDVSKWNGTIDWKKVKEAGIEYAIVRVAYSTSTTAEKLYKQNIEGAQAAGIPVGVYIYSMATTESEAKKEAAYVLKLIKGYKLQYPVAFDIEDKIHEKQGSTASGRAKNTKLTKAFCEAITKGGYTPMIYTGCYFSRTYINMDELSEYDAWIAHYGSTEKYTHYTGKYHYGSNCNHEKTRFWQYSSLGKVNGINGNVDMNYELDLKQSVYGMAHYNVSKGTETYLTASGETLSSIADKYNVSVSQLNVTGQNYTATTKLAKGNSIAINSKVLSTNGVTVSNVTNVKTASAGFDKVKITWSAINYSNGYYIYRATSKNGTYKKVGTVTGTSFTDKGLTTKKTYYYKVYGYKKNNNAVVQSKSATAVAGKPVMLAPSKVWVTDTQYNSVSLKWNKSEGAYKYKILVATKKNGTYKTAGYSKTNTFTHKKLTLGKTYYYKVQAVKSYNKKNYWSAESKYTSATTKVAKAKISKLSTSSRKATIKYGKISGASGYAIYRSTKKNGTYTRIAYTTKTSYTNKYLTKGKRYYYKVRAYRVVKGKKVYGSYSNSSSIKIK